MSMHNVLLRFILALPLMAPLVAKAEVDEILSVKDAFGRAIREKDVPGFLDLFLNERVVWQPATRRQRVERSGTASQQTPRDFIERIASSDERIEETFANVEVDTDGAIASVAFDYRFLRNDHVVNAGREYWLMVKTDVGWKIVSVVWSRENGPQASGVTCIRARLGPCRGMKPGKSVSSIEKSTS